MARVFYGSILCTAFSVAGVEAIDNGIGVTPPRGWRSWNQFQLTINQSAIEAQYEALVDRSRMVGGVPMSLLDLGYETAGIDDGWQACGSSPGGFHNASGYPNVNTALFPDMKAMTNKAKSLKLKPGWYGNNCDCHETQAECQYDGQTESKCFTGDVQATMDFGFQSIKLDGCGVQKNVTHYAELFNATGVPVMIENCHNGNPTYPTRDATTGNVDCPMNFFRSSTDIRPTFGSILINLETTRQYNEHNLTGPGCWAYPDMLEVGVTNSQRTAEGCVDGTPSRGCTLSVTEARTHFNAWSIVSAPLVLGNDLTDTKTMDSVWPIISNQEALAVNHRWAGDAGTLAAQSSEMVTMQNCSWFSGTSCQHPSWMVWKKLLAPAGPGQAAANHGDCLGDNALAAVLIMNNADTAQDVVANWKDAGVQCPRTGCVVRDLDAHKDLGTFGSNFTAKALGSHASRFLLLRSA